MHDLDSFYSDAAIREAAHDVFGRDGFAQRMADVVGTMGRQSDSSVAALVGPWGSGKSSILNLFENHIKSLQGSWKVRRFNPWLFSDIDSLLVNFFSEIETALPEGKRGAKARKQIGGYAKKLAPLGNLGAFVGADLEKSIEAFGRLIAGEKSAFEQQVALAEELKKLDARILIVMDDVDRLQPDELLLVLKLIRLIGDLPNVHYLLAYDERTLLDVLMGTPIGNNNEGRASQYIDKMVQVRFDLPPLTDHQQDTIFSNAIEQIASDAQITFVDTEYHRLTNFYDRYMRETLRVPRRINKYFGQLAAFLTTSIAKEVNVVDFSILTFLRTFHGPLYYQLPSWKMELLGKGADALSDWVKDTKNPQVRRDRWEGRFTEAAIAESSRQKTFDLLGQLFPVLAEFSNSYVHDGPPSNKLVEGKHVGSLEYFDRFFQFSVPHNDISDSLVLSALAYLAEGDDSHQESASDVVERLDREPEIVLDKMWSLVRLQSCSAPRALLALLSERYVRLGTHARQFAIRAPQDVARYMAADIFEKMSVGARDEELAHTASDLDLTFNLDVARTIQGSDIKVPWLDDYIAKIDARFQPYVSSNWSELESVDHASFGDFKTWGMIQDAGIARDFAQARITEGTWNIDAYLALLTNTNYMLGVSNPKPQLAELEESWIEHFLGVEFAIEKLGTKLDEHVEPLGEQEYSNPATATRLRHALLVLREIRARHASATGG